MQPNLILFDLGGVLIELRIQESLSGLMPTPMAWPEIKSILLHNPNVRKFESGLCPPEEFATSLIKDLNLSISETAFIEEVKTWPVGFYDGAKEVLATLRKTYKTGCLSNTNELHWQQDWVEQFDHPFASHLIQYAKPDPAAFEYVLTSLNIAPETILFFDDSLPNIEIAKQLGFMAYHTDGFDSLCTTLHTLNLLPTGIA